MTKAQFRAVQSKYQTLIPAGNGKFITYHHLDTAANRVQYPESNPVYFFMDDPIKKWGMIDSAGKVVIPFVCDGIKMISESEGVFSTYEGSYSLNTGIPRYVYEGFCYFFDQNGVIKKRANSFNLTVVGVSDFHHPQSVIDLGPGYFLPVEYRQQQ